MRSIGNSFLVNPAEIIREPCGILWKCTFYWLYLWFIWGTIEAHSICFVIRHVNTPLLFLHLFLIQPVDVLTRQENGFCFWKPVNLLTVPTLKLSNKLLYAFRDAPSPISDLFGFLILRTPSYPGHGLLASENNRKSASVFFAKLHKDQFAHQFAQGFVLLIHWAWNGNRFCCWEWLWFESTFEKSCLLCHELFL